MLVTLDNGLLCLAVDTAGAQMMHLVKDGVEHLWQGDPKYWSRRAPVLFPFIGRLWNNSYSYNEKTYTMGIHGFASELEFTPVVQNENCVELSLKANGDTQSMYPFLFDLSVIYKLVGDQVEITYQVKNLDDKPLPFAVGGHPGFNVPFTDGEQFEDYYLEFSTVCQPDRIGFSPNVLLSGNNAIYPLDNGKYIKLRHDLFDDDAITLQNMCREITLRTSKSGRFIKVSYPDMPYLGLWHRPKTDASYLCIEPWSSLPARQDVVEELSCKSDLIHLLPNDVYRNTWTITVGGK